MIDFNIFYKYIICIPVLIQIFFSFYVMAIYDDELIKILLSISIIQLILFLNINIHNYSLFDFITTFTSQIIHVIIGIFILYLDNNILFSYKVYSLIYIILIIIINFYCCYLIWDF